MKVLHGDHVFLSLHGLPQSVFYTVHLSVAPNQDLWMDEGWNTFVNKIRNGENRIMLIFRYVGRMKFVVWRFTSDGSMMLRNPEPPSEDIVLHTRLKVKYPSFVTDPWDISSSSCSPPEIIGPIASILQSDEVTHSFLHWESRPYEGWSAWVIKANPGCLSFHDFSWEDFCEDNKLHQSRVAMFTYTGGAEFSVLVFDVRMGTIAMTNPDIKPVDQVHIENNSVEVVEIDSTSDEDGTDVDPVADHNVEGDWWNRTWVEPVDQNYQNNVAYPVKIFVRSVSFNAAAAKELFNPGSEGVCTIQRSDGTCWKVKAVTSNNTLVLSKGYKKLKRDNGWKNRQVIRLHRMASSKFVFQA
ncbi:hypothetical protein ACLB2K_003994 [Fragaria x ananassa]